MEGIPTMVRRLVAAEQRCNFVHYYPSFCDVDASPTVIPVAAFTAPAQETADSAAANGSAEPAVNKLVYDVLRTRDRRILFKQLYAERFTRSLALAAPAHTFPEELRQTLQERLQRYIDAPGAYLDGVTEQNLKIVSWVQDGAAAASPIPVLFLLPTSSYPAEAMYRDGAKLGLLYNAHRVNPNAKVAQTALRERANAYQAANGLFEVLLVHSAADRFLVPEGSRSNYLLLRRDGTWWCSAPEDILVGVTLQTTYRVVEACGLGTVQHGKLTVRDILECKSLFMLGTSPTILPLQSILLYNDDDTRRCFTEAATALEVNLAEAPLLPIAETSDLSKAELHLQIDTELAARLRAQYIAEAAAS